MSVDIQIKVTAPKFILLSDFVRFQIMQKMQGKTGPELKRMFERTVDGWNNKPNFLQKFMNSPSEVSTTVWTGSNTKGGKIYSIVNNGAPKHPITPRRKRTLRFQKGYTASTRPRVLSSHANARFGPIVSSFGVIHPGFEAREFDGTIAKEYRETFRADMQEAIRIASVRRG